VADCMDDRNHLHNNLFVPKCGSNLFVPKCGSGIFTHGQQVIASGVCRGHCLYPSMEYIHREAWLASWFFLAFSVGENAELGDQFPYRVVVYSVRFLTSLCLFSSWCLKYYKYNVDCMSKIKLSTSFNM